ncbi:MAG: PAS domain S-box protein, partial [Opitutaceae bacterium]
MSNPSESRSTAVRILLLTHDDAEAQIVARRLGVDAFPAQLERVFSLGAFATACAAGSFEVILIDVDLPDTGAWRALKTARRQCSGVPIVLLSSSTGSELASELSKHGATNLVAKGQPGELVSIIARVAGVSPNGRMRPASAAGPTPSAREEDSDSIFRQIADQTEDIICLHGPDGLIEYVTPSVNRLLGYQPEDWAGRRLGDFVQEEDAAALHASMESILMSGEPAGLVVGRYRHKQKGGVWMATKLQPIRDAGGAVVRIMTVSSDCTERRGVEESLRRGERLFEGIAEANRLLLTSRRVMESMSSMLRVLGEAAGARRVVVCQLRTHSISGRPVCSLCAEWTQDPKLSLLGRSELVETAVPDPEAADEIAAGRLPAGLRGLLERQGLKKMLQFAVPVHGRAWGAIGFEQDGEGDRWSTAVSAALEIFAFNIGQAVEREDTLAALADSQRRYEALLAGLSEAVFQIDLEARWRFLNPTWEELTGFRVDESIGRRFSSYVAPDEAAAVLEGFGRLVSGRDERIENEIRFLHRLGSEIWLRVTAQPQYDEDGHVIGVSGTLIDVTQRRMAMEAMRASERKFTAVFEASSDALFLFDNTTNLIVECNPRAVEMFE